MSHWDRTKRTDGTCEMDVNRGDHRMSHWMPCGRLAEKEGLCSLHLKVEAKRTAKGDAIRMAEVAGKRNQTDGRALAKRLGVKAYTDFDWCAKYGSVQYPRRLVIEFDAVEKLLKELGR